MGVEDMTKQEISDAEPPLPDKVTKRTIEISGTIERGGSVVSGVKRLWARGLLGGVRVPEYNNLAQERVPYGFFRRVADYVGGIFGVVG